MIKERNSFDEIRSYFKYISYSENFNFPIINNKYLKKLCGQI